MSEPPKKKARLFRSGSSSKGEAGSSQESPYSPPETLSPINVQQATPTSNRLTDNTSPVEPTIENQKLPDEHHGPTTNSPASTPPLRPVHDEWLVGRRIPPPHMRKRRSPSFETLRTEHLSRTENPREGLTAVSNTSPEGEVSNKSKQSLTLNIHGAGQKTSRSPSSELSSELSPSEFMLSDTDFKNIRIQKPPQSTQIQKNEPQSKGAQTQEMDSAPLSLREELLKASTQFQRETRSSVQNAQWQASQARQSTSSGPSRTQLDPRTAELMEKISSVLPQDESLDEEEKAIIPDEARILLNVQDIGTKPWLDAKEALFNGFLQAVRNMVPIEAGYEGLQMVRRRITNAVLMQWGIVAREIQQFNDEIETYRVAAEELRRDMLNDPQEVEDASNPPSDQRPQGNMAVVDPNNKETLEKVKRIASEIRVDPELKDYMSLVKSLERAGKASNQAANDILSIQSRSHAEKAEVLSRDMEMVTTEREGLQKEVQTLTKIRDRLRKTKELQGTTEEKAIQEAIQASLRDNDQTREPRNQEAVQEAIQPSLQDQARERHDQEVDSPWPIAFCRRVVEVQFHAPQQLSPDEYNIELQFFMAFARKWKSEGLNMPLTAEEAAAKFLDDLIRMGRAELQGMQQVPEEVRTPELRQLIVNHYCRLRDFANRRREVDQRRRRLNRRLKRLRGAESKPQSEAQPRAESEAQSESQQEATTRPQSNPSMHPSIPWTPKFCEAVAALQFNRIASHTDPEFQNELANVLNLKAIRERKGLNLDLSVREAAACLFRLKIKETKAAVRTLERDLGELEDDVFDPDCMRICKEISHRLELIKLFERELERVEAPRLPGTTPSPKRKREDDEEPNPGDGGQRIAG